ncbi:RNA-guided pseudouridylation complex pseudouridine synthase subunit Cbf5 [Candidatus Woesearchaeota archaeon]|nr:RNA-guided pseudouridylation complex pseudouridine synthase subunit Cbf5 [Candidatus Woesearchaeota archaeon]
MSDKLPFEKIERKILTKLEGKTDPKYGCNPENRQLDELITYGIVVIDKPPGPTSHQTSDYVKKILGLDKAGHSGTLDPKVTGVLPVALGRGTRIVQSLLSAGKEYVCLMHLHSEVSKQDMTKAFSRFTGKIMQMPPIKSAIKRQLREREIYYIELLDLQEQDVLFRVGCQAGTYIRKLCHDMGEELGVGAHMSELRRTKAGPLTEQNLVTLQQLTDAYHYYKKEDRPEKLKKMILPLEQGVEHLPKIFVHDSAVNPICHGQTLKVPGISKLYEGIAAEDSVAIMTLKGELISTATARMTSQEIMKAERGIAASSNQVFMSSELYPKTARTEQEAKQKPGQE